MRIFYLICVRVVSHVLYRNNLFFAGMVKLYDRNFVGKIDVKRERAAMVNLLLNRIESLTINRQITIDA